MKDKIPALTSLRFFASASIVCFHSLGEINHTNSSLALGVSFFFVLSGFILTYAHDNSQGKWIARFYLSRFARIWPVHIVTLIAAVFLIHFSQYNGSPIDILRLIENLLLVHAWYPAVLSVFSFNGVSWSLSVEVVFYLLFPLVIRLKHVEILYIASLAVTFASIAIAAQYLPRISYDFNQPSWMPFVLQNPIARLPEFLCGVIAARWHARSNAGFDANSYTSFEVCSLVFLAIFVVSSPLVMDLRPHFSPAFEQWVQQSGGMIIFAMLVFSFSGSGIIARALSWSPLVLLGEISFCTYMVHLLILQFVAALHIPFSSYTFAVVIPAIYVVSFLMWRYVERPCRAAIMSVHDKRAKITTSSEQLRIMS